MKEIYLKEDSIEDIDKLDAYNKDYLDYYSNYVPFVTPENYHEILQRNKLIKNGIGNDGVCEIFYWAILDDKIIGHASIRLNPEIDEGILKYCGHIMYGVIPSERKKGYGVEICHLLIKMMDEMNYSEVIITCNSDNIASSKVIENNYGELIEVVEPDMINAINKTRRYKVDVKKSLEKYSNMVRVVKSR